MDGNSLTSQLKVILLTIRLRIIVGFASERELGKYSYFLSITETSFSFVPSAIQERCLP